MSTIEEWLEEAKKGTHEDMVYSILGDWQKDREKFLECLERLEKNIKTWQTIYSAK